MWTTLTCRPLIAWPPPTKDHTIWGTRHSKEYCRLVTAHTSAPRKRYKDTIKKALKTCSIVLKHRTATAEMPGGALPSTKKTESGAHLESGIHQQEFRIQYVKSGTYIMESKIQYCFGTPCMRQTTRQQHRSNTLAI